MPSSSTSVCKNCKKSNTIFIDYSSGDSTCNECGAVNSESHIQDDVFEHREFEDSLSGDLRRANTYDGVSIFDIYRDKGVQKRAKNTASKEHVAYYEDGVNQIRDFFKFYFPDSRPRQIECRSLELFHLLFYNQKTHQATPNANNSKKAINMASSIYLAFEESPFVCPLGYSQQPRHGGNNISSFLWINEINRYFRKFYTPDKLLGNVADVAPQTAKRETRQETAAVTVEVTDLPKQQPKSVKDYKKKQIVQRKQRKNFKKIFGCYNNK